MTILPAIMRAVSKSTLSNINSQAITNRNRRARLVDGFIFCPYHIHTAVDVDTETEPADANSWPRISALMTIQYWSEPEGKEIATLVDDLQLSNELEEHQTSDDGLDYDYDPVNLLDRLGQLLAAPQRKLIMYETPSTSMFSTDDESEGEVRYSSDSTDYGDYGYYWTRRWSVYCAARMSSGSEDDDYSSSYSQDVVRSTNISLFSREENQA